MILVAQQTPPSADPALTLIFGIIVVALLAYGLSKAWEQWYQWYEARQGAQVRGPALDLPPSYRFELLPQAPVEAKQPEPSKVETPAQPAPAPMATDAAQRTVAAVAALPPRVLWDRETVKASSMPLMQGADGWHALSILDSQHTVVCGASNSGKGNVLRLMAVSVLSLGPDVAHLWVFDTKSGVDYPLCTRIDHARLYANVKYADGIEKDGKSESKIDYGLKLAKAEMDRRNDLMFGKATNIHTYNKKVDAAERLPIIVLILDEFADFNAEQKELTETLVRQGRSAGFVVFLATQYPTAAVLSSQIQANCLRRICLRVDSAKRTLVSLGLEPGEARPFEPSAIASSGVAVYKTSGGTIHIGRVPYITDELYDVLSNEYAERWPRAATESGEDEAIADEDDGLTDDARKLLAFIRQSKGMPSPYAMQIHLYTYNNASTAKKLDRALQLLQENGYLEDVAA